MAGIGYWYSHYYFPYAPEDPAGDPYGLDYIHYVDGPPDWDVDGARKRSKTLSIETLKKRSGVAAIMLNWKRLENVKAILRDLRGSGLYTEFVVWNNNPETVLSEEMLFGERIPERVLIVHSAHNIKDMAKYLACGRAVADVCYYQDDDWDSSSYRRSLLVSYMGDPSVPHGITNPKTYMTDLVWSCFAPEAHVHTGFMWIGCGTVFSKASALRHLSLMRTVVAPRFEAISDVFFTMWFNNPPVIYAVELDQDGLETENAFNQQAGFDELQYAAGVAALSTLWDSASKGDTELFPASRSRRHLTQAIRPDDGGLFLTNLGLYREFEHLPCSLPADKARITSDTYPCIHTRAHCGALLYFGQHVPVYAVDGNPATCFEANVAPGRAAAFGFDLLAPHKDVTIRATIRLPGSQKRDLFQSLPAGLNVSLSLDAQTWSSLSTPPLALSETRLETRSFSLDAHNLGGDSRVFRAFLITLPPVAYSYTLQVCELTVEGTPLAAL